MGGLGIYFPEEPKIKKPLLARASELPSPMPPGHFLSTFGQSDRTSINSANQYSHIAQPLAMINSPTTYSIIQDESSALNQSLAAIDEIQDKVKFLYRTFFAREPRLLERKKIISTVETEADVKNLAHAMLCASEFLVIQ